MFRFNLSYKKWSTLLIAGAMAAGLSSCNDSIVFDDLPECVPEYRVRLSYDHNMAFEERVNKVEAAEVYAFDADGNLAATATADLETLKENDWTLPLKLNRNQEYQLVIWGGLTMESPFRLDGSRAFSSFGDVICRLGTETDGEGHATSSSRLPALFHGTTTVTYTKEDGYEEYTAKLVKNTNQLDVVMRRKAGSPVGVSEYKVKVTDANGVMDHTNSVSGDDIHYLPVEIVEGNRRLPDGQGGQSQYTTQAVTAEMHVARLMKDSPARLIVNEAASGKEMFNVALVDLLLAAKENIAPNMDDQEFLDRQDEYDVELILPSDETWHGLEIYINNWVIVYNDIEWK